VLSHNKPLVTIAVPSLNQGAFLDAALQSIFDQGMPVEVVLLDAGSVDNSAEIIKKWSSELLWWRSEPDKGQAAAINEGIESGTAPFVCWLNSDDIFLPGGLKILLSELESSPASPAAYGKCWAINSSGRKTVPYPTLPFWPKILKNYCFIAQPATLIRRRAWESVNGLDESLQMALDYDLWWRLYGLNGQLKYINKFIAATRRHFAAKTSQRREEHYKEAMETVLRHTGKIPVKWHLARPLMVTARSCLQRLKK